MNNETYDDLLSIAFNGIHEQRYDKAIEAFNKAFELVDKHGANVWEGKGVALMSLKYFEQAIECFENAIQIDPFSANTYQLMSGCLKTIGRYEASLEAIDKCLAITPYSWMAWGVRYSCLDDCGRSEEAEEARQRSIVLRQITTFDITNRATTLFIDFYHNIADRDAQKALIYLTYLVESIEKELRFGGRKPLYHLILDKCPIDIETQIMIEARRNLGLEIFAPKYVEKTVRKAIKALAMKDIKRLQARV